MDILIFSFYHWDLQILIFLFLFSALKFPTPPLIRTLKTRKVLKSHSTSSHTELEQDDDVHVQQKTQSHISFAVTPVQMEPALDPALQMKTKMMGLKGSHS